MLECKNELVRIARAAAALQLDSGTALPLLREVIAMLWKSDPTAARRSIADLEKQINLPVEDWLPEVIRAQYTGPLMTGGVATPTCEEIVLEGDPKLGWEVAQERVVHARDVCRTLSGGQDHYVRFRLFLIEHPLIGASNNLEAILLPIGLIASDFYQPVPVHLIQDGCLYPCPRCGWPMAINADPVRCGSNWCEEQIGHFGWRESKLQNNASLNKVPPFKADGLQMLISPIWKFTLMPGLLEVGLVSRLRKLGHRAEMWPDFDRVDVVAHIRDEVIAIDAKVWSSSYRLLSHLIERSEGPPCTIVIPNSRAMDLSFLRSRAPKRYQIETESSFFGTRL